MLTLHDRASPCGEMVVTELDGEAVPHLGTNRPLRWLT
jgi:hypothetical protein